MHDWGNIFLLNKVPRLCFISAATFQKMAVKLGDIVPNFSAATTHGKIDFHTWVEGRWVTVMMMMMMMLMIIMMMMMQLGHPVLPPC